MPPVNLFRLIPGRFVGFTFFFGVVALADGLWMLGAGIIILGCALLLGLLMKSETYTDSSDFTYNTKQTVLIILMITGIMMAGVGVIDYISKLLEL